MAKEKRNKPPKVKNAEILDDGCLLVDLGVKIYPHTTKILITPEALLGLGEEYGDIPPKGTNDFDGVPMVDYEDIFDDDGDDPSRNGATEDTEPEDRR